MKPLGSENPSQQIGNQQRPRFPGTEIWLHRFGGPLGAGALATVFFLALLWRDPMLCWNDDYAISILPVLADVARSWNEGHWPLLSPYCWACGNLAGEYQYGTFSIFVNLVVVLVFKWNWSYPATAAALSAAHLFVMAAGGYQLAAGRGHKASLAVLVGLIAALNGWIVCWGATNWFGALAALAWLPWAWWALEESLRMSSRSSPWRRSLLPAPFIYLLAAGGFPYTVITLIVITGGLAIRVWVTERRLLAVSPLVIGWGLGLGLSAPAWLSLLEYMQGSARAHGDDLYHNAWVVPWRALPGLVNSSWGAIWPDFAGRPLARPAMEFTGSVVPLSALVAVAFTRWRRRAHNCRLSAALKWDVLFAGAALMLCMLPTAGVFRWSFRWLPFLHLALALAGVEAFRCWRQWQRDTLPLSRRWWEHPAAWALALTGASALLSPLFSTPYNFQIINGRHPALVPAGLFGVSLLWLLGVFWLPGASRWRSWLPVAAALGGMAAAYVLMPTNPRVPRYPFTSNLNDPAPLSRDRLYLAFTDAPYLAYHGDFVPPGFGTVLRLGSTAMFGGVHFINGYSPIRAAGVAQAFKLETHGQIDYPHLGEFLTPEMAGAEGLLARIGVDGLIVAGDLPFPEGPGSRQEWEKAWQTAEGTVYLRRGGALPDVRVWHSRESGAPADLADAVVEVKENSRQRVVAQITRRSDPNRPVLVAFRRPYFPGYHATFNGQEIPVASYRSLLPTVELPAGGNDGTLILSYRPRALVAGAAAAVLSLSAMAGIAWMTRTRVKPSPLP